MSSSSSSSSVAEQLADELACGELDVGELTASGGSGKQRSKLERLEHKKPRNPEGDTRRITQNAMNGVEKRREEERSKNEKKERKPS